jgi:GGDEF domain-containing protein
MNPGDDQSAYPPKLQPALRGRAARIRREARWVLMRFARLGTSEGPIGVARGSWRWTSRMLVRLYGMGRLSGQMWWGRRTRNAHFPVAFVDVDGLSRVDQALGRPAATRVVKLVGRELRANLGPHALVFRYGGDEYVCTLPTSNLTGLSEKLVAARADVMRSCGRGFTVGIAQLRPDDSAYTVVKRAELHMFGAKAAPGVALSSGPVPGREDGSVEAVAGSSSGLA